MGEGWDLPPHYLYNELEKRKKSEEELGEEMTRIIHARGDQIKRGDLARLSWIQYRNEGLYIYDGEKLIPLGDDETIDEYGYVPPEFTIPEFDPHYWSDHIDHNFYVWVHEDYFDQMCDNITEGLPSVSDVDGKLVKWNCTPEDYCHTWFEAEGRRYYVVIMENMAIIAGRKNIDTLKQAVLDDLDHVEYRENNSSVSYSMADITEENYPTLLDDTPSLPSLKERAECFFSDMQEACLSDMQAECFLSDTPPPFEWASEYLYDTCVPSVIYITV